MGRKERDIPTDSEKRNRIQRRKDDAGGADIVYDIRVARGERRIMEIERKRGIGIYNKN